MSNETPLQNRIQLALGSMPDVRLFRNTVGEGWVGRCKRYVNGEAIIAHARHITFGLQVGSGDLIGWKSVVVTNEMVGKRIAIFTSIEVKGDKGRASAAQINWQENLHAHGGIAAIVDSVEKAELAVR